MPSAPVNIFGSCVSRDAISFVSGLPVAKYCARQSLVSAVAPAPGADLLQRLVFAENTHDFHRRCVEEDFGKRTLDLLAERPAEELVIVDFIEERVPLAVTTDDRLVTYSQAATGFSNARELVKRLIEPYSDEHVRRFAESVGPFIERLQGRGVVLHRALYAPGDWNWQRANAVLDTFHDMLLKHVTPVAVIDVPADLRVSSPVHKWGVAPYHYVDDYYRSFVRQWTAAVQPEMALREDFSLQKTA